MLFLGTPPHAAVATSVELAQGRAASWRKLINAVLRRLSEAGPAILAEQDAARLNTPDWLWRSWSDGHGEDRARAIAGAHLAEPPLDLSVKAESERWAAILGARLLSTGTLRLDGAGGIAELAGFADGAWWVQDAGAALPARLFGEVRGRAVIDLCCAPGGKTAQLAAAGAIVHAIDRSPKRLARVRANLDRLALDATLIEADATSWRPDAPAPCVLLDAPCSATGTIRRHPDVARLRTPEDIVKLAGLQARLLDAAARMVAPGGLLVYSTCSLEHDEGEKQIAAFLSTHREFTRRHVSGDEIGGHDAFITPAGDIRTLPCHLGEIGGIDGFYAARLHRQGN